MSEIFAGFVDVSYGLTNKYAAVERTSNWYLQVNEESNSEIKFRPAALEPSPCNQPFCTLPVPSPFDQPNRGLLELRGSVLGVNGTVAFSIDKSGAFTNLGTVANDGLPCVMYANGNGQVFIGAGTGGTGEGYVIPANAVAGSLISLQGNPDYLGCVSGTFQDGYGLNVLPNSNAFQISGTDSIPLGDLTQWDAANESVQAGQADYLRAIISSREYVRLLGYRRSQVYQNVGASGAGGFPFANYNETFIETGCAAAFSLVDLGESLMWIGEDIRGQRAAWRDSAFSPQRVSTFAVEQKWESYTKVSDAVAFSYIWQGHAFYRITFPTSAVNAQNQPVSATWEYDATASTLLQRPVWCERTFLNTQGVLQGRPELFHCYAYGVHLVGSGGLDGNPGAIYQMAAAPWTDCAKNASGTQVQQQAVRDRICPHQWRNNNRRVYDRIEFEFDRGVGLSGSPVTGANPVILLRWSNDGGNTWTPEQSIPAGQIGQYLRRVYWNRCGYSRDRVFWLRCSDPVYWGIVNAMLAVRECAS